MSKMGKVYFHCIHCPIGCMKKHCYPCMTCKNFQYTWNELDE